MRDLLAVVVFVGMRWLLPGLTQCNRMSVSSSFLIDARHPAGCLSICYQAPSVFPTAKYAIGIEFDI